MIFEGIKIIEFVKICGLKKEKDIDVCYKYGANAVGFIYNVSESPRNLNNIELEILLTKVPEKLKSVIVLKPKNISEILDISQKFNANLLQIHGNFNLAELNSIPNNIKKRLIIALKINEKNKLNIIDNINKFKENFFAFLLDNSEGKGKEFSFSNAKDIFKECSNAKIIIAGGINNKNIEKIIKELHPFGIDASSSLESHRGIKDPKKIIKFLKIIEKIRNKGVN
ncbi:MAG TPA: phosphoribosylanthranilate isomerase [Candidatus Atribacteria bacterium]|nr:phosphoribosylanthranilate isomerase [Candidatus Atribacteria bacterium]